MEVLRIAEIRQEGSRVRTLLFEPYQGNWMGYSPGQFVMVWVPGVDEVPMSLSYLGGDPFRIGITVQDIGEATHALCSLEVGSRVGIRGPYGRGFDLDIPRETTVMVVSGGVGAASTIMALERARKLGYDTVSLTGGRSSDLLIFKERIERSSSRARFSTDDGSFGEKGFVTHMLQNEIQDNSDVMLLVCGPEPMMERVHSIAAEYGVRAQYSLERYMKCGVGVCDSCAMSGRRVCQDGPVFTQDQVSSLSEFGRTHRDRAGRPVPLKECVR